MDSSHKSPFLSRRQIVLAIGGVIGTIAILVGFSFGLDIFLNPWAYGLFGRPSPMGEWVGSATLANGKQYRIRLNLQHSAQMLTKNAGDVPDITGDAEACTTGLPANTAGVSGTARWTASSLSLSTSLSFNESGAPSKLDCTPSGDLLNCVFDFRREYNESTRRVMKKIGRDPDTAPVTAAFARPAATATRFADICSPK